MISAQLVEINSLVSLGGKAIFPGLQVITKSFAPLPPEPLPSQSCQVGLSQGSAPAVSDCTGEQQEFGIPGVQLSHSHWRGERTPG